MRSGLAVSGILLQFVLALQSAAGAPTAVGEFRFAIIGDRTGAHQAGVYERTLEEVRSLAPDLVLTVGDHIEGYTEDDGTIRSQWAEYDSLIGGLGAPFVPCPGNHDILNDTQESLWREIRGRAPNSSYDFQGVHFVFLDTGRWDSSEEWLAAPGHREWLESDLAAHASDRLTLVFFHKPFWYRTLADGKTDPLHAIFLAHGVDAVWNGHYHCYSTASYDGIAYTMVGSSGGSLEGRSEAGAFHHWVWCTVRGGTLTWAVIARDGVRPFDTVLVEDQKFYDRADREYVRLATFAVDEDAPARARCALTVHNPSAQPLSTTLAWSGGDNWRVEPAGGPIEVPPGGSAEQSFDATLTGTFHPLPRLAFAIPYRAGRVYHYDGALPAVRIQTVGRLAAAPVIDGVPDEDAWNGAGVTKALASPDGGAVTISPTMFLFGYDDAALYLAARCTQQGPETYVVAAKERDGAVSRDDCVGYFLCADPKLERVLQIYMNAAGVVYDAEILVRGPDDYAGEGAKWNGDFSAMASRGPDGWSSEIRVPYAALGAAPPGAGSEWRTNFRRKEMGKGSSADWLVPITWNPERFGVLRFQ